VHDLHSHIALVVGYLAADVDTSVSLSSTAFSSPHSAARETLETLLGMAAAREEALDAVIMAREATELEICLSDDVPPRESARSGKLPSSSSSARRGRRERRRAR